MKSHAGILAALAWTLALASAVRAADISAMFGNRVSALPALSAPVAKGDFAGTGEVDQVYFVRVGSAAGGKTIAPDVRVVSDIKENQPLSPTTKGSAIAIVMARGKYLVIDPSGDAGGWFDTPMWSSPEVLRNPSRLPISVEKRTPKALKTFPCLRKPLKGDVLLVGTEAGIDVALDWTGSTYKMCYDPTAEP